MPMNMATIIEHFTAERIPNPNPAGEVSWQLYHTVRNAVFRCCKQFGTAGPMGERPIIPDEDESARNWHVADHESEYYIIDDQYNHECYVYLELLTSRTFSEEWVTAMMQTLGEFPGWGAGLNAFPQAYVLIFADKLLVKGKTFEDCSDLPSVVACGAAAIERYQRTKNGG